MSTRQHLLHSEVRGDVAAENPARDERLRAQRERPRPGLLKTKRITAAWRTRRADADRSYAAMRGLCAHRETWRQFLVRQL